MTLTAERETEVVYPDPTPPVLGGFQGLPARPGWFSQHVGTAANTKLLPPFAYTYVPDANGADGGFYPDNIDPYSNSEIYGATPREALRAKVMVEP